MFAWGPQCTLSGSHVGRLVEFGIGWAVPRLLVAGGRLCVRSRAPAATGAAPGGLRVHEQPESIRASTPRRARSISRGFWDVEPAVLCGSGHSFRDFRSDRHKVTAATSKDLSALCETAAALYHRLVLVVGPARSGKTRLLQATAAANSWPLINLNQRVSELLLELTQRQRALRVPRLVDGVVASADADVVVIDNLELLFSPRSLAGPVEATSGACPQPHGRGVVARRDGRPQLTYAEPGHPEYRRYPELDTLWLSLHGRRCLLETRAPKPRADPRNPCDTPTSSTSNRSSPWSSCAKLMPRRRHVDW